MKSIHRVLIIGKVWPEPRSSAAGSRMLQLMEMFKSRDWEVTFVTAASDSDYAADLELMDIRFESVKMNDSSFDESLKELNPDMVLFDRFMTEEQFGWRVAEHCPDALRVLDTEDLHSLREGRRLAMKQGRPFKNSDLNNEIAYREIASILRCDLSLIISEAEMEILESYFRIQPGQLHYLPFVIDNNVVKSTTQFVERKHFTTIGNFLHEPNFDSVKYLKESVWPGIRNRIPEAELHIYGAYPSQKVTDLNDPSSGFIIKGRAEEVYDTLQKYRVLLAPLRFGAGLKGKLLDALLTGTPSVTTTIGAEGMNGDADWPGYIENDPEKFSDAAVLLYQNEVAWKEAASKCEIILEERFQMSAFKQPFLNRLEELNNSLTDHRNSNFTGQMLMHHSLASTRFMGKWIEEKNKR